MEPVEPVAIVGIGCRFPSADGPEAFWRLLAGGVDAIAEVPPERWDIDELHDDDPAAVGKMNTRWGGFVANVDRFDAAFFGISPREAAHIDPQQRLLLEVAWEALEDAGLPVDKLGGERVGVFVGMSSYDYGGRQLAQYEEIRDGYVNTGSALSIGANRISYHFDFRGPSVVIDSACSSSLVAAHYACQSLRRGESQIAIAGGVNLILSPAVTIGFSKLQAMAPDGRCKAFDARANGYVRGEGAGLVVLKTLASAVSDGDRIYALIRGGSVNQDGRTNGLTAPNGLSQEALIREALANAGVRPSEIQYVEAHGTGTALGDPIELNALGAALAPGRSRDARCAVGSVKTNFGHLEAAAGVAGLIKLALSLQRRQVPPSLHFKKPNPYVRFDVLPLRVVTRLETWPTESEPARGGVSSFGFGGTNAHLVLEEPPAAAPGIPALGLDVCVLPLSARSEAALWSLARSYVTQLRDEANDLSLGAVCATAANRRSHHDFRLAAVAASRAEMATKLAAFLDGESVREVETGRRSASRRRKLAFVFPGQGSQWLGMGRELCEHEPVFADVIEKCDAAFAKHVEWSLVSELGASSEQSRFDEVDVIQPAIFAIEVALAQLWRSWGIKPDAVVGHSMGEVAAAHIAGSLSLADAARIICGRSRLARRTSGRGAMAVVDLSLERSMEILSGYEDRLAVAVSNSPTSTVLSGERDALEDVLGGLEREGVFCRRIKVDYASHSPQMDPLRDDLLALLAGITARRTTVPLYSTVDAAIVAGTQLGPEYWVRNLRKPVLFASVVEKLLKDGIDVFLEVSPHPILLPAIQQCLSHFKQAGTALGSLRREQGERRSLLSAVASLYAVGKPVEWGRLYREKTACVTLPAYPWQRERFWFDDEKTKPAKSHASLKASNPLIGEHIRLAGSSATHLWQREISADAFVFLNDHRVRGAVVVPATAYIEMALEAAAEALGEQARFTLESVRFENSLVLAEGESRLIQVLLTQHAGDRFECQVFVKTSRALRGPSGFSRHARGDIRVQPSDQELSGAGAERLGEVRAHCSVQRSAADYYQDLSKLHLAYGPAFQVVESVWTGDHEAVARLAPALADARRYHIHPALLSSATQVLSLAQTPGTSTAFVPISVDCVRLATRSMASGALWAHAVGKSDGSRPGGDVRLLTDRGEIVAELRGIALGPLDVSDVDDLFYALTWERQEASQNATTETRHGGFLIFADATGVADSVAEQLRACGGLVVLVTRGAKYHVPDSVLDGTPCRIDPLLGENYTQLLEDLTARGSRIDSVVHLWSLDVGEDASDASTLGSESALLLVQALVQSEMHAQTRLWLGTRGAQCVHDGDDVSPFQAPLWGFARTVVQEHPELVCAAVDLGGVAGQIDTRALVRELWQRHGEQQVAFREGERFVARLRPVERASLDKPSGLPTRDASATAILEEKPSPVIRDDSTYVVTGGLGGLGLVIARWLVDLGARTLVLIGRRPPSPEAREAVDAMARGGANIVVDRFDVSNAGEVDAAFARWARDLPPVRGIVHAAGVLDDGILLQQTPERFRHVMAPKVAGAWNLHQASLACPLDVFVLFSSATSVLGSAGQSNYAAANQFLDALAHYRRRRKLPGVSINWGPWSEVGLAARPDRGGRLEISGIKSLSPRQGVEALGRVLVTDLIHVLAMSVDWREWRTSVPAMARMPFFSKLEATPPADVEVQGAAPLNVLATPAEERETLVVNRLRQHAATVLRLPASRIDLDQPLIAMGIDSLMAVELKGRIERDLGITVPLLQVIKGPSLSELARTFIGTVTGAVATSDTGQERVVPEAGKSLLLSILSLKDKDPVETA